MVGFLIELSGDKLLAEAFTEDVEERDVVPY
jgi:hypothetical protein